MTSPTISNSEPPFNLAQQTTQCSYDDGCVMKMAGADEDVNTIRFFDTHANMLYQNNYNYSQTIASGGVIATFGLRMLQIFTLLI